MALDPQVRAVCVSQLANVQRLATQRWLATILRTVQVEASGGANAEEAIAISLDAFDKNVQAIKNAEAALREKGLIT